MHQSGGNGPVAVAGSCASDHPTLKKTGSKGGTDTVSDSHGPYRPSPIRRKPTNPRQAVCGSVAAAANANPPWGEAWRRASITGVVGGQRPVPTGTTCHTAVGILSFKLTLRGFEILQPGSPSFFSLCCCFRAVKRDFWGFPVFLRLRRMSGRRKKKKICFHFLH